MVNTYCVDTSAWIDMKAVYPFGTFPSLWHQFDSLIKNNGLLCPQHVYIELKKWDDDVFQWVNQRKRIFRQADEEHISVVGKILKKFPNLIDQYKETEEADPFVVALAIVETKNLTLLGSQCDVVSQERRRVGAKPKIPDV